MTWRMLMDETMMAEGFTRLTYEIEPIEGAATKLTVIHELEGAPTLAAMVSGEAEAEGAGGGWAWALSDLKSLLETGKRLCRLDPSPHGEGLAPAGPSRAPSGGSGS